MSSQNLRWLLAAALVLASGFLALGVTLPLVRFEKLYFFEETPSLVQIVEQLATSGDWLLALLVGLLSIVFPVIKLLGVTREALASFEGSQGGMARLIPVLSKWSMADVLIVALVIVAAKTSGVAQAFSQPGLWFYAGSTLLATAAHWLVTRLRQKALAHDDSNLDISG